MNRSSGNQYTWTDEERRESMFDEVLVRWHANWPDTIPMELHAYQLDHGPWYAWVFRNEWNDGYGQVGTTRFSGQYATERMAQQACREFIANDERRTLMETSTT